MNKILSILLAICTILNMSNVYLLNRDVHEPFAIVLNSENDAKEEDTQMTNECLTELLIINENKEDLDVNGDNEEVVVEIVEKPEESTEDIIEEPEKIPMGEFKITYYCPCYICSEGWGHKTSTGAIAEEGRTIAVDPSVIPYGSEVYIDGHKYIAEDRGGGIKGNDIDIFLEDHWRTERAGVDYCDVEIVLR